MDNLQTEARNPDSMHLDELSALEIVRLMNREDGRAVEAVAAEAQVIARVIDLIAQKLAAGGRLVYGGAGTSGRLGVLDATECPPTFNTPPGQVVGARRVTPTVVHPQRLGHAAAERSQPLPRVLRRDARLLHH